MKRCSVSIGGVLLLASLSANAAPARFLDFYPSCDYKQLGATQVEGVANFRAQMESKFEDRIQPQTHHVSHTIINDEMYEMMMADARQKLYEEAGKVGASEIALTNVKFSQIGEFKGKLVVDAEFIGACLTGKPGKGKPTQYDYHGRSQGSFTRIAYSKVINIPAYNVKKALPDLIADTSVSLEKGMYGVNIGDTYEQVEKIFGEPTFTFYIGENWKILAYGRSHWLTFSNDTLVEAKYGESLFGNELVNNFEFDERFDDRVWQVNNVLRDSEIEADTATHLEEGDISLTLVGSDYLRNNQAYRAQVATGFILQNKAVMATFPAISIPENERMKDVLAKYMNDPASVSEFDASFLPGEGLGRTKTLDGQQYILMSPTMLVKVSSNHISGISVNNDFLKKSEVDFAPWTFENFQYGELKSEAVAKAGEDSFVLNDVIEIDRNDYLMTLYVTNMDQEARLYSIEMKIY